MLKKISHEKSLAIVSGFIILYFGKMLNLLWQQFYASQYFFVFEKVF